MNFTLLITVRDRQENIWNLVKYYAEFPYRKIIVDSSNEDLTFEEIRRLKEKGFDYWYMGNYSSINHFLAMYNVAKRLEGKTDYILECPDNNVVLKVPIHQCLLFLENNKDYVACDGEYFFEKEGKIQTKPNFFGQFLKLKNDDFKSTDVKERIEYHFENWHSINHAIMKHEAYMKAYELMKDIEEIKSITFLERIFTLTLATFGNFKKLPTPYMMRSFCPGPMNEFCLDYKMEDHLEEKIFEPVIKALFGKDDYFMTVNIVGIIRRYFLYYSKQEFTHTNYDWAFFRKEYQNQVNEARKVFER